MKVYYHSNIALGAHSRRTRIERGFVYAQHMTLQDLQLAPAPLLNRFEKYRISFVDILDFYLDRNEALASMPVLQNILNSREFQSNLALFVQVLGPVGFYGFAEKQTLQSAILALLMSFSSAEEVARILIQDAKTTDFLEKLEGDVQLSELLCTPLEEVKEEDEQQDDELVFEVASLLSGDEKESESLKSLLLHSMESKVVSHLLDIAMPEFLLRKSSRLPRDLLGSYLKERRHFDLPSLLDFIGEQKER